MNEPVKLSDECRIREYYTTSIVIILVTSLVMLGLHFLSNAFHHSEDETQQGVTSIQVTEDWLNQNLYQVEFYLDNGDGTYEIYPLAIQEPTEETFEELKHTFMSTPYSNYNSFYLKDGVNCQGMVCYIAKWCKLHDTVFSVEYTPVHTYIIVDYEGISYKFDFTREPVIIEV